MPATVKSEIDHFSEVYCGHGVDARILARWLSDVDGYIAKEVLHLEHPPAEYSLAEAPDTPLLVYEPPHRRIYFLYLSAMTDFVSKQYNDYANGIGAYNRALSDYVHSVLAKK